MLYLRQIHDRVRYIKTGHYDYRHKNADQKRVIMLTKAVYETYDNRAISLDDINSLYI